MSKVAKNYLAMFACSLVVVAVALAAISGFSAATLLQPFFWISALALTALAGLAKGEGIGGSEQLVQERLAARAEMPSNGLMA
jgi:hypothetical protein